MEGNIREPLLFGFNQIVAAEIKKEELSESGVVQTVKLDLTDLCLLDFVSTYASRTVTKEVRNGELYFNVKPLEVKSNFPFFQSLNSFCIIQRFKKWEQLGIVKLDMENSLMCFTLLYEKLRGYEYIEIPKKKQNETKLFAECEWRQDFNAYLEMVKQAEATLKADEDFKAQMFRYYPTVDYEKTIEKAVATYWGTQETWEVMKRKRKSVKLNMVSALKKNFDKNRVYLPFKSTEQKSKLDETSNPFFNPNNWE